MAKFCRCGGWFLLVVTALGLLLTICLGGAWLPMVMAFAFGLIMGFALMELSDMISNVDSMKGILDALPEDAEKEHPCANCSRQCTRRGGVCPYYGCGEKEQ